MPKPPRPSSQSLAYSYLRFSSVEQAKGDSVRRQVEFRAAWLKRNSVTLDESRELLDKGRSAFSGRHRSNPDRNALAAFLELVKSGKVARGSYLIVENLDRLTREDIRPALTLLLNLIESGIRVVQLLPVEQVFDENVEPMTLMMAIMELSRGHSESKLKSERIGRAWGNLKRTAAVTRRPITKIVPSWLKVVDGKFTVVPGARETIRRIYRMATEGYGVTTIAKTLNAEQVPTFSPAPEWQRPFIAVLLKTRRVMGEYQPRTGRTRGKWRDDGKAIPNYYPAMVSEDEFNAARAVIEGRDKGGGHPKRQGVSSGVGRVGGRVNLFVGMLRDARDGELLYVTDPGKKSSGPRFVNAAQLKGRSKSKTPHVAFLVDVFEGAILSELREIDPREILPGDNSGEQVLAMTSRLRDLEAKIAKLTARMKGEDDIDPLVDLLRGLDAERQTAATALEHAQREAASPLSNAWGEYATLVDALAKSKDVVGTRTRLRAVLQRVVDDVRCLFVALERVRIAVVQVWFAGGKHRDYVIMYRIGYNTNGTKEPRQLPSWHVRSFVFPSARSGEFDLRTPGAAAELESVLGSLDVKALFAGDAAGG